MVSLAGVAPTTTSGGEVTLKTIWMKQAGYSETEIQAMTDAFTAANPNIKVDLEFVQYEALHDKIVPGRWMAKGCTTPS